MRMRFTRRQRAGVVPAATAAASIFSLALLALLDPAVAQAQAHGNARALGNGDGMDTHLFRPAVDSKGFSP